MGLPGTTITCTGAASDDVGYLNIGAEITVLGDATNGVCNAMANGKVYIGGSIGARGLTMTNGILPMRSLSFGFLAPQAIPLPSY